MFITSRLCLLAYLKFLLSYLIDGLLLRFSSSVLFVLGLSFMQKFNFKSHHVCSDVVVRRSYRSHYAVRWLTGRASKGSVLCKLNVYELYDNSVRYND